MGQYYEIYNLDKRELITPHSIGNGAKLIEFGSSLTSMALCLLLANSNGKGGGDIYIDKEYGLNLKPEPFTKEKQVAYEALQSVSGRWAGDRIVIQGDYAKEGEPGFISNDMLEHFTNIGELVVFALKASGYFDDNFLFKDKIKRKLGSSK